MKKFLALNLSDVVFILLINVKRHFNIYEQDKFCAQLTELSMKKVLWPQGLDYFDHSCAFVFCIKMCEDIN